MEKAKKRFNAIFSNVSTVKPEIEVQESLSSKNLKLAKLGRHGFPFEPRCMAYDPVQRLLAVGQGNGAVRILGEPGVDVVVEHETSAAVLSLHFLVNEGALVSVCRDDTVHLWNLRQKRPEVVHSLQFQKEQITCVEVPFGSQWFYIGTERGNIHVASVADFALSGYVINWNKAIDISMKHHPGPVRHLSDSPTDEGRLLIGFEKGTIVLWDLKAKVAESRYCSNQILKDISWHYEGKSFVAAHSDGSLSIWNVKKGNGPKEEPSTSWAPHSRGNGMERPAGSPNPAAAPRERCRPIPQVDWTHGKAGAEEFLVFSGGLALDESGCLPGLTILRGGKSATVLEMEDSIVGFLTLCKSAYPNEAAEPFAVAVLLASDLLIVDLHTPGYPCFENPYPMDLHESPVTLLSYLADCPSDLIALFYSAGAKQKRTGFVDKKWPISGGAWGVSASGKEEIILTAHADGSLKFWNAASEQLQLLYKLKTGRHFERAEDASVREMEPLGVTALSLCPDSRLLAVANRAAQVSLFKFVKFEATNEVPVLEVPIFYSVTEDEKESSEKLMRQASRVSVGSDTSIATSEGSKADLYFPLKARGAPLKRPSGYQPALVCLTPWHSRSTPESVRSLALNSAYGLMAYGTGQGVAVVDIAQHLLVLCLGTPDLYPPGLDPFTRLPKPTLQSAHSSSKAISLERGATEDPQSHSPHSPNPSTSRAQGSGGIRFELWDSDGAAGMEGESKWRGVRRLLSDSMKRRGSVTSELPRPSPPSPLQPQRSRDVRFSFNGARLPSVPDVGEPTSPKRHSFHARLLELANPTAEIRRSASQKTLQLGEVAPVPLHVLQEKEASMSRSSSCDSQDSPLAWEAVTVLEFLSAYTAKGSGDAKEAVVETPSLWVGTSSGSVLLMNLSLPPVATRLTTLVSAVHSGSLFRGKGPILCLGFLDASFSLLAAPSEKKSPKEGQPLPRNKVVYKSKISVLSSSEEESLEEAYVVVVSERGIQVVQLPTQAVVYTTRIDAGLCKAQVTTLQSSPIVTALSSGGRLQVFSLPSLRPLLDKPLLPAAHILGRQTLCMSHDGHGAYMSNESEMEKITICADMAAQCREALGDLFVGVTLPEREKPGFLKGFFGASTSSVDRDELFKEDKGRASKSVARTIAGSGLSGVSAADIKGDGPMAAVARTKLALIERSEKLSKTEEATANMAETSEQYSRHASALAEKMKNKKWYQL